MLLIPEPAQRGRRTPFNRGILATQSAQCLRQLPQPALQLSMYALISDLLDLAIIQIQHGLILQTCARICVPAPKS